MLRHNGIARRSFGPTCSPALSASSLMTSQPAPAACREGESWFEEPSTHHLLAQNDSTTQPAKLLAIFISNQGDPLKLDDVGKPDSLGPGQRFGAVRT